LHRESLKKMTSLEVASTPKDTRTLRMNYQIEMRTEVSNSFILMEQHSTSENQVFLSFQVDPLVTQQIGQLLLST